MADWLHRGSDESGARLARGVATIVVAGAALGLGVNAVCRAVAPGKGLAWIRVELPMRTLESMLPPPAPAAGAAEPAVAEAGVPAPAPRRHATAQPSAPQPAVQEPAARKPTEPKPAAPQPAVRPAPAPAKPAARPAPRSSQAVATAKPSDAPPPAAPSTPPPPIIPDSDQPLGTSLGTIKALYDANAALIVDARGTDEYAASHIRGAVNLPFDDVAKDQSLVKRIDAHGKPIVVYCDGGECELSKDLAAVLVGVGYRKVLVYTGGLPEWQSAGYPTTAGGTP